MSTGDKSRSASPRGWQLVFTTDALPERDRFAAYREEFAIPFGGVEVSQLGESKFHVEVCANQFGDVRCAKFSSSPTEFKRTGKLVHDGDDSIYLLTPSTGRLHVWQREMSCDLEAGDAAIVFNGEQRGGVVEGEGLGIQIPRAALTSLLPHNDSFAPSTLLRDAPATRLLLGYINSFLDCPPADDAHIDDLISRHVVDLLALAIGPSSDAQKRISQGGLRAARLRAIMADVRGGIGTRDLSVSAMARQHGISARYVQMLFEAEGMTYSEFVLAERLARACRLLADRANLSIKISEIAYKVGFSDLSYFNRAFRRRFGVTPSEMRGRR